MGEVVEPYDADKNFSVYGFGGDPEYIENDNYDRHCFPLNGNIMNDEVHTIDGILKLYRETLPKIDFVGPTNFASFLDSLLKRMQAQQEYPVYQVMLILTDGAISDLDRTKDKIIELSYFPCSIIIIGVGDANFDAMEDLDADKHQLRNSRGLVGMRDIVQFVPFREAKMKGNLAK